LNVGREEPEIYNALKQAALAADAGGEPVPWEINEPAIVQRINLMGSELGILVQRDLRKQREIAALMPPLLNKAVRLGYNVANEAVFRKIFWLAAALYGKDYTPMRVMGVTAEGMVKGGNNNNNTNIK
jgi:hypothetical protein